MVGSSKWKYGLGAVSVYLGYTVVFMPVVLLLSKLASPLGEMGLEGILIYSGLFVILATLMVPSSLMKLVAGALFGFAGGALAGVLGAYVGALVPFYIVRKFGGRKLIERKLHEPKWRAVDAATTENGLMLTVLIRLSLVLPYNFSNYILGATDIKDRDYALGNVATIFPTLLYAWWGAAIGNMADIIAGLGPDKNAMWWVTMATSALVTIAGAVWMHRASKRKLQEILSLQNYADE